MHGGREQTLCRGQGSALVGLGGGYPPHIWRKSAKVIGVMRVKGGMRNERVRK